MRISALMTCAACCGSCRHFEPRFTWSQVGRDKVTIPSRRSESDIRKKPAHTLNWMSKTPQAILYEASNRSLARQQSALDNIRVRAGTLLAAAAIVTSFLGAEALKDPGSKVGSVDRSLQLPEILAIAAFVGLAITVLVVLWPRGFIFRVSPSYYLKHHIEVDEPWTAERLQRNLAIWQELHVATNQKKLDCMMKWFQAGSVLLVLEVVAWLVDLT